MELRSALRALQSRRKSVRARRAPSLAAASASFCARTVFVRLVGSSAVSSFHYLKKKVTASLSAEYNRSYQGTLPIDNDDFYPLISGEHGLASATSIVEAPAMKSPATDNIETERAAVLIGASS